MINLNAICNGLAARFAAGTLATPSGAQAIRGSSGQMPKQVSALPYAYVEPTDGTVVANDRWEHQIDLDVVFLLDKRPGDPVRVEKQRQLWLGSLLAATEGQLKLGLAAASGYEVAKALPTTWRWAEESVGAIEYDAIRITFRVWVYETVSLTA